MCLWHAGGGALELLPWAGALRKTFFWGRPLAAVVILARASDLKGIWQAIRVVVSERSNLDVQVPAFAPATALHTAREDALAQVWHSSCDAQMLVCP
jgi:hypothetical protein